MLSFKKNHRLNPNPFGQDASKYRKTNREVHLNNII